MVCGCYSVYLLFETRIHQKSNFTPLMTQRETYLNKSRMKFFFLSNQFTKYMIIMGISDAKYFDIFFNVQ